MFDRHPRHHHHQPTTLLLLPVLLLGAACADDLAPGKGGGADGGAMSAGGISSKAVGDVIETTVDATRTDAWVYFDFESNRESIVSDPGASREWDLAFQRFKVKSNGGVSGGAGVEIANLEEVELAGVTAAPANGWQVDQPDGEDMNPDPDTVFNRGEDTWFEYDSATHLLAARKRVYVVRTPDDTYYAVQILKYYDMAGTAGNLVFRWKKVTAPSGRVPASPAPDGGATTDAAPPGGPDGGAPVGEVVEATSAMAWTYVKVGTGTTTPAMPGSSLDWDLGFQMTRLRTNGGTSGLGMGAARLGPPGVAFDALTQAPADGYQGDSMVQSAQPGVGADSVNPVLGDWYDYDPATHTVKPKDVVFVVRTASGGFAKLQIMSYSRGSYRVRLAPLAR